MATASMLRWARALVLSTVVLATTLAAHTEGGGTAPDASLVLPLAAILTVAAAACLGRPPSAWRIAALLLTGQALLHAAFELMPSSSPTMDEAAHASMGLEIGPAPSSWLSLSPTMLLAHAAAALVTGCWLAAGERAVWTIVALATGSLATAWHHLRRVWLGTDAAPLRVPGSGAVLGVHTHPAYVLEPIDSGVSRRGPPGLGIA